MGNYTDKEFREQYQEILDDIKTLTSKWDPSVSDESDPGVVILKAFGLFTDKINYRINYRNAQNSVKTVSDSIEGGRLFSDLGYQVKKRRSATGELSIKYLGTGGEGEDPLIIDLFTEFSNQSGNQVYTSVRSYATIPVGEQKLVKVQEGISRRYTYEGVEIFNQDNLTNNLRLPLMGIGQVSDNGVVITSNGESTLGLVSDWLNVGDNFFNSVETNNLYSVGHDPDGVPYIQFYEESLPGLQNGIGIWTISSSGAAGNISQNRINRITSSLSQGDSTAVSITHPEFTNGTDAESLESAMKNYYETFGINDSLIGERDYRVAIEKELGPDLKPMVSKALVTGVDGYQNLVEIVSNVSEDKRVILTKFILQVLLSSIFVNALKYSNDYYTSFQFLQSEETEKLIRKALFKKKVVSNNLVLVDKIGPDGVAISNNSTIYDKFIFDITSVIGTVIVDSTDSVEQIKDNIVSIISTAFNSRNLTTGEMISESLISSKVKNELSGAIDTSFYYSNHKLAKRASNLSNNDNLTQIDKRDIVARSVLRGDVPLFEENILQLSPGASSIRYFPSSDGGTTLDTSSKIIKISSKYNLQGSDTSQRTRILLGNEFIQFYSVANEDETVYGFGIKYRLLANQYTLSTRTNISQTSIIKKDSIIKAGSDVYSAVGIDYETINNNYPGTIETPVTGNNYIFLLDYTVGSSIQLDSRNPSYLEVGSVISDGSTLNGEEIHGLTIPNGEEFDLKLNNAQLILQTDSSNSSIITYPNDDISVIKVEGFSGKGLGSSGPLGSGIGLNPPSMNAEKIITMVESSFILTPKFYYGLILKNKTQLEIVPGVPYLLEEGEHLIYSDEDLLDFVDFGSGTMLSVSGTGNLILNNVITYEDDIATVLQKLPQNRDLKISNTNIYTFSNKETVVFPAGNSTSTDWTQVIGSFKVTSAGGEDLTFDNRYKHREGLIIKTGPYGAFSLEANQEITLTDGKGNSQTFTVTSYPLVVSVSNPMYINAADTTLDPDLGLSMAIYWLAGTSSGVTFNPTYDVDSGFSLGASLTSDGNGSAQLTMNLNWYLIELSVNVSNGGYITVDDGTSNPGKITILNIDPTETNLTSGTYTLFVRKDGAANIRFNFNSCKAGDNFNILRFRDISDLNPDLSFASVDPSQNYSAVLSTEPTEGSELLSAINSYILNNSDSIVPFDFFYEIESPIKNPTEALKYYDTQHLMNRNILTVINLDDLRANLKIVKRYRNDRG